MRITLPKASSTVQALLVAATLPLSTASAADFTISNASTSAQTLTTSSTGTVTATGTLTLGASSDKVAVTITGNDVTLNNLGAIVQNGTGRVIRDNTGVTNLVINNGSLANSTALLQAADADVIQMNKSSASVTLNNYGTLTSLNASVGGAQAVDFSAITSGANIVNNYAGGVIQASEADAVRPGVNGAVNNSGTIRSTRIAGSTSGTDAIDAQNNSGVVIINDSTGVISGARHGITGGQLDSTSLFTMSITNKVGGLIMGNDGAGINLDGYNSKQTATIYNSGTITGQGITGDGDGVDVDGIANITNTGVIRSINAYSPVSAGLAYSEGISIGGGVVINSGTIEGLVSSGNTNAVGRGITLAGNDLSDGTREGLYGNATITNLSGGLIRGQSDSAIVAVGAASGYSVTINNNAGATIIGGGSSNAAIKTGADNTVITTGGTINGASSGKAIEMGSGNNSLTITGGSITGSINGGSGGSNVMIFSVGAGNSFSYSGAISNFSNVEVQSGTVILSGVSSYTGATRLSGGTLTLDGANRLSASSALVLNGGTLRLTNAAGVNGQSFASLSLTDSSSILLGGSSLTFGGIGAVVSGKTLTFTEAASGSYAFRLLGDYSTDASFLQLLSAISIDGLAAQYSFDGTYTAVSASVVAAVPEPETYLMLFAGLALVGTLARRSRQGRIAG